VEVDVSALEFGALMTVQWRKQPIWIVRPHDRPCSIASHITIRN